MEKYLFRVYNFRFSNNSRFAFLFSRILRFSTKLFANIFLPLWYSVFKSYSKLNTKRHSADVRIIVSFTTFPSRINKSWIIVESILRQELPPDKIILWLSREQFPNLSCIPKSLTSLEKYGLEIRLCDYDIKSHKKYFYVLQEFPNDFIILIDDDFIYSPNLIKDLYFSSISYSNSVIANRALIMSYKGDILSGYNTWRFATHDNSDPNMLFYTSGGGTLIPPNALHPSFSNVNVFLKICKFADDVWLNAMTRINGTSIFLCKSKFSLNIPLIFLGDVKLSTFNVGGAHNDVQISNVRNYCEEEFNVDPFKVK